MSPIIIHGQLLRKVTVTFHIWAAIAAVGVSAESVAWAMGDPLLFSNSAA